MNDKDNEKLGTLGTNIGWIICCVLGLLIGKFVYSLLFELGMKENPVSHHPAQIISSDNSKVVHRRFTNPAPPNTEETEEVEMVVEEPKEEPEKEVDSVEEERLANWKANFPYKPTTDPDVVITGAMLEKGYGHTPVFRNHGYMRHFFENETRFTASFEQLYRILEEHGREGNPMVTGDIFECLRDYHRYMQNDPERRSTRYNHRMRRHLTNAESAESSKESIVALLQSERKWPSMGGMPEDEAIALRDRIINEIQGMNELPTATKDMFVINMDYGDELKAGDSPLVISQGWQAAYDKKFPPSGSLASIKRMLGVDENNVLLVNGEPIQFREGENTASIITPDGYEVPLWLDDDGKMIIPTPTEIEEMIKNGEATLVEIPKEGDTQPPRQLTEEEWRLQEAQRMLQETSRQQE